MKDVNSKLDKDFTFSHPLFMAHPLMRSFSRIVYYVFIIILVGFIVSLLISGVRSLLFLGVFLSLMFLDYIIHIKEPLYSIGELRKGKVPSNNLILCVERDAFNFLLTAFENDYVLGGDIYIYVLSELTKKRSIEKLVQRLDIDLSEFHKFIEKEIANTSKTDSSVATDINNINFGIKNILSNAVNFAEMHSYNYINIESLFSSVMNGNSSSIKKILDRFSVNPEDIEAASSFSRYLFSFSNMPKLTSGFAMLKSKKIKRHRMNRSFTSRPTPTLDRFSKDVTDIVRGGGGGFLIGHNDEYMRLVNALSSSQFKSSVLVGDPGIGKETIIYHLAFDIVSDNVPKELFDRRVVELSINDLISGVSSEKSSLRIDTLSDEIVKAGNIILYIPDIHNLFRTSGDDKINLSDIFIPIIKSTDFPIVGSTTPALYKRFIEMHPDFEEVFESINVNEMSKQDALRLLVYDAMIMEKKYKTSISFMAIKRIVELSSKYIKTKPLPSSAQDVLREAFFRSKQYRGDMIKKHDIDDIIESKTKIPIYKAGGEEAKKLLHLEDYIHKSYINQSDAVKGVSDALRSYRSGLGNDIGPLAVFLFVGPTGVGKTELSKILADVQFGSRKNMVRMDMSEYQQKSDIVKFIGSSDGKIVGHLTERVKQQPYTLILLDEFEKAHPDILNLFLQVFDDGRLTDGLGHVIDFSNTIIIATSNAESLFIQNQISSGKNTKDFSDELKQKLGLHFRPELLNRFSNIVVFRSLSLENIEKIAELKLNKLVKLLSKQDINISFNSDVIKKVAELGYDPKFGARPIDRAIESSLTSEISKNILSEKFNEGDNIFVSVDSNGKFIFSKNRS